MSTIDPLTAGRWLAQPSTTTATFTARNFLLRDVEGTIELREGFVDVDDAGRPILVHATLASSTVATGNRRRDKDLRGQKFLAAEDHPELRWDCSQIEPAAAGWTGAGALTVAGRSAPLVLEITTSREPGEQEGMVVARGVLDLRASGIRAPGILVGRYVRLDVRCQLAHASARVASSTGAAS